MAGYWFGKKAGPVYFERKDTWIFKKKHLIRGKIFMIIMEKRLYSSLIFSDHRTFAPIVAGIVKMPRKNLSL